MLSNQVAQFNLQATPFEFKEQAAINVQVTPLQPQ